MRTADLAYGTVYAMTRTKATGRKSQTMLPILPYAAAWPSAP